MAYKLRTREYDYNESLFKELGIETQEVEGHNFLEISNIITKKYRELARKSHSDKTGGSDEKMQAINEYKAGLLKYTKPLSNGKNLIIVEEKQRCVQLASQGQNDKRIKCLIIFGLVDLLLLISSLVSYLYLGFRLFKAANFTNAPGILFSASLITAVTTFFLTTYLTFSVVKKAVDLQNSAQRQGENLTQEDKVEMLQKERSEYKISIFASQYMPYLSCALLVAGLALQYQFGCMDSKVLIGFVAVLGCILLLQLATEIYERKVVDLVKTEGRGTEQRAPVGMLTEKPSSTIDPDGAFNASAHEVG